MRLLMLAMLASALALPAADAALVEVRHGSPTMAYAVESMAASPSPARADFDRWTVTVTVRNEGAQPAVPGSFAAFLEAPAQVLPSLEHQDVVQLDSPVHGLVPAGESRRLDFVADVAHGAAAKEFALGQRFGCIDTAAWLDDVQQAFLGLPDGAARWQEFSDRTAKSLNAQAELTCTWLSQPLCLDASFHPLAADDEPLSWTVEWVDRGFGNPHYVYEVRGAVGSRYAAFGGSQTSLWFQTLGEAAPLEHDCGVGPGVSFDIYQGVPGGADCRDQVSTFHLVYMGIDGNVTTETKSIEPPAGLECVVPDPPAADGDSRGLPGAAPLLLALAFGAAARLRR